MNRKFLLFLAALLLSINHLGYSQAQQLFTSQQFRLGDRIIRIAEPGQLADSINVWGDIGSPGRYLVPKGTTLPKLISYGFGPSILRDGQTDLDWSKMRVEVHVQEYDAEEGRDKIEKFRYRFEEPFPEGMHDFQIENNQTITLRVKRRPTFRDYIGVVAPVISAIGTAVTAYVLIDSNY
ncbi:MAG: hypothetical protein ED557_04685 [Balneola sp.]|nr:MAG: hypothetical protein ED557_04685 [Balneola sp.]